MRWVLSRPQACHTGLDRFICTTLCNYLAIKTKARMSAKRACLSTNEKLNSKISLKRLKEARMETLPTPILDKFYLHRLFSWICPHQFSRAMLLLIMKFMRFKERRCSFTKLKSHWLTQSGRGTRSGIGAGSWRLRLEPSAERAGRKETLVWGMRERLHKIRYDTVTSFLYIFI